MKIYKIRPNVFKVFVYFSHDIHWIYQVLTPIDKEFFLNISELKNGS